MHTPSRRAVLESASDGPLLLIVLVVAYLVLLLGAVAAVRWMLGAELWLTLPVLNAATSVVIVSELAAAPVQAEDHLTK